MDIARAKKRADFFGLISLISLALVGLTSAISLLMNLPDIFSALRYGSINGVYLTVTVLTALLSLLSIPGIKRLRKYPKKFVRNVAVIAGIWLVLAIGSFVLSDLAVGNFFSVLMLSNLPFVTSLAFLVLWIAALIAKVGVSKGRDWAPFFVLSLFFPVIMWIVVSVISGDPTRAKPEVGMKVCPRCAELVKNEATLCKHCGTDLSKSKVSPAPRK